jgi:hypothetical protein
MLGRKDYRQNVQWMGHGIGHGLVSHGVAECCMCSWRPHFFQGSRTLVAKSMASSKDIEQFRSVLRKSKNIVAIAGAGLSAASGQITFSTLSLPYTDRFATAAR